ILKLDFAFRSAYNLSALIQRQHRDQRTKRSQMEEPVPHTTNKIQNQLLVSYSKAGISTMKLVKSEPGNSDFGWIGRGIEVNGDIAFADLLQGDGQDNGKL